MNKKWELVEDGYHRRQRLIEYPSGKIVGWVSGSKYDEPAGWHASISRFNDPSLGNYITEGMAMKAVENALPPIASEQPHE